MRLNKAEFWLVETAVLGPVPLDLIGLNDQSLRLQWNKPPHHLSQFALVRVLEKLLGDSEWYHPSATRSEAL
jgi:hypothetical protein